MASGSEYNPYQPPTFDDGPDSAKGAGQQAFATRVERLAATVLDTVILLALLLPAQLAAGVYDGFPKIQPQTPLMTVLWGAAGFTAYVVINGYWLAKNAQTIGKRLLGIRVVNFLDGEKASLAKLVLWRLLPFQLVALIPYLGAFGTLLDALLIFRKDYRCIHDHVAGTIVVKVAR